VLAAVGLTLVAGRALRRSATFALDLFIGALFMVSPVFTLGLNPPSISFTNPALNP
jgi:hypothetical protein